MVATLSSRESPDRGHADAAFAASSKPLVLVVEDHEDTRFLLKYLLTMRGFDVAEAENGEEGVDMAERLRCAACRLSSSPVMLNRLRRRRRARQVVMIIWSYLST